jgi:N-acetylmuramoyl-L-alanine amidase
MQQKLIKGMTLLLLLILAVSVFPSTKTQLVFNVKGRFYYQHFLLEHPLRYVVDVYNAKSLTQRNKIKLASTPVAQIRIAHYRPLVRRIVLDLRESAKIHSFVLKTQQHNQYRLVFDLNTANHTQISRKPSMWSLSRPIRMRTATILPYTTPSSNTKSKQAASFDLPSNSAQAVTRKLMVVIDPGHGGKDPGATGQRGTHEKNVVLAISKALQRDINKQPGFKAVLTRRSDYFIPLRGRLAIARKYKADLFIAIHADAYRNRQAEGVSVFALSSRGATSEAARWLARRENKSELMGGVQLNDKSNILKSVLINLSQTASIRSSLLIGQDIINKVRPIARLHHSRVEQAAFVVLKSPDIPSLLVETGFLSNAYEERRLRSARYQQTIAHALMTGIKQFFVNRPPRNTWLAYWRDHPRTKAQQYQIARGDTLSGISDHFRVTVATIRNLNNLASNQLKIGQKLLIPRN